MANRRRLELKAGLGEVSSAAERLRAAKVDRDREIRLALRAGFRAQDVADAARVSRVRVYQILSEGAAR